MAISIIQPIEDVEALFDSLNVKVQKELQDQYDCKKINGATYADVWSKMMSQVVAQSVGAIFKETETDRLVKLEQIEVMKKDIALKDKQIELGDQDILNKQESLKLTTRQIQGFDDNAMQKLYDSQMNAWALMFSSGLLEESPSHINDSRAGTIANSIYETASGGTVDNPLGYFTQEVSATSAVSGGTSTISWGSVSGGTTYTLYVSSNTGSVSGYPKTVTANGTDTLTIPTIPNDTSERFIIKVTAANLDSTVFRSTETSITVDGPIT